VLAANIMSLLTQRRSTAQAHRELDQTEARFRILADTMPQMVWSTRPDGFHDYYNARWYEYTGMEPGSTDGEAWNGMFHPEDQARAWAVWQHSLETGEPYEIEYRLRNHSGEYRWTLGRALPIRAADGKITRWFGTCTDIHESRMLQEQRVIVSHELSHRIKNIFSIISGLITFTTRYHPEMATGANALRDRILALGRAHNFIRPDSADGDVSGGSNSLKDLLGQLLAPYQEGTQQRITMTGADIEVDDRSATPLALLFHELATNAVKYGALANDGGSVAIRIVKEDGFARIFWQENGGPDVTEPSSQGFGSQLINMSIERQMGGIIKRDWLPSGLSIAVSIPLASLNR